MNGNQYQRLNETQKWSEITINDQGKIKTNQNEPQLPQAGVGLAPCRPP